MSFSAWGERNSRGAADTTSPARRPAAEPTTGPDWQRLREQPRPQDLVLSPLAETWRDSLHQRHRPTQLCELFPRVANRLALCRNDPALMSRVLDELVIDRRRDRAGFPPEVTQELIRLRLLRSSRSGSSGFAPLWDTSDMAICDR
jgi:hypothetical protein